MPGTSRKEQFIMSDTQPSLINIANLSHLPELIHTERLCWDVPDILWAMPRPSTRWIFHLENSTSTRKWMRRYTTHTGLKKAIRKLVDTEKLQPTALIRWECIIILSYAWYAESYYQTIPVTKWLEYDNMPIRNLRQRDDNKIINMLWDSYKEKQGEKEINE